MVNPLILGDVEPYQAQRLVLAHPREQARDLGRLPGLRPHGRLGQQDRLAGDLPYLNDGPAEDGGEGIRRPVVVTVDADPGDVARAGPPGGDRSRRGQVRVDRPQPGDVVSALAPE